MGHVLWIGGAPGAGKTAVARLLARRHGLRLYSADTRTWEHRDRALAEGNAAARRWEALTPADRWERSTPEEMLAMSLHRERGAIVVDDLRSLPAAPLVVAEGSVLPAWAVADRSRAVWLVPSAAVRRARLEARGTGEGQARLYLLLGEVIEREASEHHMPTLSAEESVAEVAGAVERLFARALECGPGARTVGERRALLRETSEAIADQVRGYCARPWARSDPETVVRAFVCECGDPRCEAEVSVPVRTLGAGPIHAPGHAAGVSGMVRA